MKSLRRSERSLPGSFVQLRRISNRVSTAMSESQTVKDAIDAGAYTVEELIDATGLTRTEVQRALDSLHADGSIALITGIDVQADRPDLDFSAYRVEDN